MHETRLLDTIFKYLRKQERETSRKIKKVYISLSEFGSIREEHLRDHFALESAGTRWESLVVEIERIPYGPELEITRLDFE